MDRAKLMSGIVKGIFGAALTVLVVLLIDNLLISLSDLPIVLIIAILGPLLTGFVSEISGAIVCQDTNRSGNKEYLTIGSVFFILGITGVYDNAVTSIAFSIGGILFIVAAYEDKIKRFFKRS